MHRTDLPGFFLVQVRFIAEPSVKEKGLIDLS